MAVELPATKLAEAAKLSFTHKLYPSYRYTLALNRSPGADRRDRARSRRAAAAARASRSRSSTTASIRRAAFFNPAGFSYPPGFPKGGTKWTTPKVIVARSFVGRGRRRGQQARCRPEGVLPRHARRAASRPATRGRRLPAGADHPQTRGLSRRRAASADRQLPHLQRPVSGRARRQHAGDRRRVRVGGHRRHGRDQLLRRRPADRPARATRSSRPSATSSPRASSRSSRPATTATTTGSALRARRAPRRMRSRSRHSRTRTSMRSPSASRRRARPARSRGCRSCVPAPARPRRLGDDRPAARRRRHDRRHERRTGQRATSAGRPANLDGGTSPLPAGSLNGAIALVSRGTCTFALKGERVKAAGGIGIVVVDNRSSEANPIPLQLAVPGGMIADIDGAGAPLVPQLARAGARADPRSATTPRSSSPAGAASSRASRSAGLTAFGHLLKPDLGAPGGQILSSTLPLAGGPFAVFDGTSMAAPHVAGAAALLLQRHPGWTPHQVKSALVSTAGAAWGDTRPDGRGARHPLGSRARRTCRRERPEALPRPGLALVRRPERQPAAAPSEDAPAERDRRGRRRGLVDRRGASRSRSRRASQIVVPGAISIASGRRRADLPVTVRAAGRRDHRRGVRLDPPPPRRDRPEGPVRDARSRGRASPSRRSCRSGSS